MQTKYYLTFEQVGIIRRIPLKEQDPDMQGILDAFIQAFRITNELDDDDTVNTVDLINALNHIDDIYIDTVEIYEDGFEMIEQFIPLGDASKCVSNLLQIVQYNQLNNKNMKTTTSKSSIQNLEEVLKRFLTNKNTFSLCNGEKENLKANLYELLSKLYDNYQLACIDINQIWVYETCYYTFTFESLVTVDRPRENIIADGCIRFMQNFTDGDGIFISFTKLDKNHWVYQLNFRIS